MDAAIREPAATEDRSRERKRELLLEALRSALAEPAESRLYRAGRNPGLFALRTGAFAEAAGDAVRRGLLEVVRSDNKGKSPIDWVRITPRGVEYLHQHDSPKIVLRQLKELLDRSRTGVPDWLSTLLGQLESMGTQFATGMSRYMQQMEALSQRVESALRRLEGDAVSRTEGKSPVDWAADALRYLDIRGLEAGDGPGPNPCPLGELYRAVAEVVPDLTVRRFHDGLRRLQDHRAIRLIPWAGALGSIAEPEYTLFDGSRAICHASR